MLDGVLHQRLQHHGGHHHVESDGIEVFHHAQFVAPEAHHFDIEIIVDELHLIAQVDEGIALALQPAQNAGQLHDQYPRHVGIEAHQ